MNIEFSDIDLKGKQPIFSQIIRYFKIQIHLAKLKSGDEVPSRRVLAAMLNINPATVQKAYKQMEEEELLITINNSKSIISANDESLQKIKKELTENEVRDFLKTAKNIKLSFKDVIDLISELWEEV